MLRVATVFAVATAVTPVQKVIQLLEGMHATGQKEKAEEVATFKKFTKFCSDTASDKKYAIKDSLRLMEQYSAAIIKERNIVQVTSKEIGELQNAIAEAEKEQADATELRTKENADYQVALVDQEETLMAIEKAITLLRRQDFSRAQAESLLQQLSRRALPVDALMNYFHGTIDSKPKAAFLSAPEALGQPEVAAYNPHMAGVIDMLSEMNEKVSDEKATLTKEESNRAHAYNMLSQDLASQMEYDNRELARKQVENSQAAQGQAQAMKDLDASTNAKNADEKYVADLKAQCSNKAAEFKERQALRADELKALEQATEVIKSEALSGSADKHLPSLAQVPHSFLQIGSTQRSKIVKFLQGTAARLHSSPLALVATAAAADPFAKVKGMISTLLNRLQQKANEEAEAKAWCDKELADNKALRQQKNGEVNTLTATKEGYEAQIATLSEEISDISAEMAATEKAMAETTEIRTEEKSKNLATIADAKAAQDATQRAVAILKEFYAKAGKATSLVQGVEDDLPSSWDKPFKGQQDQNSGVVSMLEVIQTDFARLEAETDSAEQSAAATYETFMADSKADNEAKYKLRLSKQRERTQADFELGRTTKTLKSTSKQLRLAQEYNQKLQAQCVETHLSYEDRVKKREEEIAALEQALTFLE